MRRRSKVDTVILLAIVALGLVLRLVRLDFQPLWWDEGYTVFFATRDFVTMLARTAIDIHPPLYYALLQLWMPFAGHSDIAFRLFSVTLGVATLPVIYLVGREWFNSRVGLLSAFLLAISPLHIYYSQEVRMYGLVTLLALASMALQLSLLNSPPGDNLVRARIRWILYVLATTAALYTLYFAAFVVAAEIAVILFWTFRRGLGWRGLRNWILAWMAIFILYLPWLLYTVPKLYVYVTAKVNIEQYGPLDPVTYLAQHLIAFSAGHLLDFTWLGLGAFLVVGLAGFGILRSIRRDAPRLVARPAPLAILLFLIPLLLGWLVNLRYPFHPFGYERSLLTVVPLFYIWVACGIDALWNRRTVWAYMALAALVLIATASLYDFYITPRYEAEDYRPLIHKMEELAQPGDAVLAPYPWQIGYLEAYYRGAPLDDIEAPGDEWITHPEQMDAALGTIRAASPRVWLLAFQTKGRLLEDQIANFFASDYRLEDEWYGNTRLEYFARGADPALNERLLSLAPDLQLTAFGVSDEPVQAGSDFIRVRFLWLARSDSYSYSLRLVDGAGDKQLQWDSPISSDHEIMRQGLFVPRTLAPGQYVLRMVVYHRVDASPLAFPDGQSEIELGRLNVSAAR